MDPVPAAASDSARSTASRRLWLGIDGLAYSLGAALVLWIFLSSPGINHHKPSAFGPMVYGRANRPFVSRVLVPGLVRALQFVVPGGLRARLESEAEQLPLATLFAHLDHIPANLAAEFLTACLVMYGLLLGFLVTFRCLCGEVFDAPEGVRRAVPLFALCLLPSLFVYVSYLYDFATLFLFTLGLLLLRRRQWIGFLVVVAISCFNKETAILLTMLMWIACAGGRRPKWYRTLLAVQLALFAVSRVILFLAFRENAGSNLEFHLIDHNLRLVRPYPPASVMAWVMVAALVAFDWRNKPRILRNSLWMLVPLSSLGFVFGYFDELRDYYEVFPAVVLLMAYSLVRLAGVRITARAEGQASLDPAVP
jgi:hypothetical protein